MKLTVNDDFLFVLAAVLIPAMMVFAIIVFTINSNVSVEEKRKNAVDASNYCDYIKFDGHEYVRYHDCNRAGMAHSPNCPCMTNLLERIKQ